MCWTAHMRPRPSHRSQAICCLQFQRLLLQVINVLLTILGWIPGVLHAFYVLGSATAAAKRQSHDKRCHQHSELALMHFLLELSCWYGAGMVLVFWWSSAEVSSEVSYGCSSGAQLAPHLANPPTCVARLTLQR